MKCIIPVFLLVLQVTSFACASYSHRHYGNGARSNPLSSQKYRKHQVRNVNMCQFGICQNVEGHPVEDIDKVIKEQKALHTFFDGPIVEPAIPIAFGPKNNGEAPKSLCTTKDVEFVPQIMEDTSGDKWIIANGGSFKQVVKSQICHHEKGDSTECWPRIEHGVEGNCVQRYISTKLLTYYENSDGVKSTKYRNFRIPSTCVCEYTIPDK